MSKQGGGFFGSGGKSTKSASISTSKTQNAAAQDDSVAIGAGANYGSIILDAKAKDDSKVSFAITDGGATQAALAFAKDNANQTFGALGTLFEKQTIDSGERLVTAAKWIGGLVVAGFGIYAWSKR